jgi:hypothetical protein
MHPAKLGRTLIRAGSFSLVVTPPLPPTTPFYSQLEFKGLKTILPAYLLHRVIQMLIGRHKKADR